MGIGVGVRVGMGIGIGLGVGAEVGVSFSDIPGFDPKKATAILKAAEEKSKQRTGV